MAIPWNGSGTARAVGPWGRAAGTALPVSTAAREGLATAGAGLQLGGGGIVGARNVAFSLPAVVGREGVERVLRLDLDDGELVALRRSADVLKEALAPLQ